MKRCNFWTFKKATLRFLVFFMHTPIAVTFFCLFPSYIIKRTNAATIMLVYLYIGTLQITYWHIKYNKINSKVNIDNILVKQIITFEYDVNSSSSTLCLEYSTGFYHYPITI